jgi:hypothetical protein
VLQDYNMDVIGAKSTEFDVKWRDFGGSGKENAL